MNTIQNQTSSVAGAVMSATDLVFGVLLHELLPLLGVVKRREDVEKLDQQIHVLPSHTGHTEDWTDAATHKQQTPVRQGL